MSLLLLLSSFSTIYSQNIDSLINAALIMPDDTNKVIVLNDIVWKIKTLKAKTADSLANISIQLSKKIVYSKGLAYAYKNQATIYYYQGDYDTARVIYEKSLHEFEKINFKKGIAIDLRNLGNIYDQQGNSKAALEYFLKSLKIREEIGDKKGVAAVNAAIGLVYNKIGETEQAAKYYENALKTYEELGNKSGVAKINYYLANLMFDKFIPIDTITTVNDTIIVLDTASLIKSEQYLLKALPVFEEIGDIRYVAGIDEILGLIYQNKKDLKKALKFLTHSLELREQMGNSFGIANSYKNLGSYYEGVKEDATALEFYLKGLEIAQQIDAKDIKKELYQRLAQIYKKQKKYNLAYKYLASYVILKDSLQNEDNTKKMTQLAMQYEFDKKQRLQEEEQKRKDAIQQERLKQQKMLTYFFVAGFVFMLILAFVIFKNYRHKQKTNQILEEKNQMLQEQKDKIEAQNRDITDSIKYAQRIQQALLPPDEFLKKQLPEYFIFFRPRDIVSGDFYWATENYDNFVFTAADCTGHGVPGAFMSMLGISFLNEIVNKYDPESGEVMRAHIILNHLRNAVKTSLRQTGSDDEAKDGMDMALIVMDKERKTLQYAGAHNPLFIIRNGELLQYKADKMPVGIYIREKESFTNHEIHLQKGDIVYMFSDGYVDQFGGEKGKKFMIANLRKLLLEIHHLPMNEQKNILEQKFDSWISYTDVKGEVYRQIDDVLIIGFRV
ncbi:MAG: tetratricopeptide repeat protein [Bacteroidales bacterium]|nr:tetratricopeptide repeat protein [Bacteroidales bacterium]